MNLLEQQLEYPLGDALPDEGCTIEVAPGIKWIRMGLPFALNHINLWLLRDEMQDPTTPGTALQGWTVVDCCISKQESKAQWETIFSTQLENMPILRVIVTHMHPDHIGLAHWLCERWTTLPATVMPHDAQQLVPERAWICRLWASATDFHAACHASRNSASFGGEASALFLASHGLNDADSLEKIRGRVRYYANMVPHMPDSFVRLLDGQTIAIGTGKRRFNWRCISGYGHAPEHMALHCEDIKILISGDMVLPRISTNISVHEQEPEANVLSLFLESIDKFSCLHEDTLVLPSHGKPFCGLHLRVAQLHDHHRDRLEEVMQACSSRPCHAADILPIMFKRPLDLHQTTFAMGEALAHLHFLWFKGALQRALGADGVYRFSLVAAVT